MACPLKSFPIALNGFSPSHLQYDALKSQLALSITWGSGTDIPEFLTSASVQSGELYHSSFNNTSISYNSNSYSLFSVQITEPTHSRWLNLTDSEVINSNNQEDVILTFINSGELTSLSFIILVNPIIRVERPIQSSAFLTSFANQTGNSIGPDSLFPNITRNQFVYYTTCGRNAGTMGNMNVLVVVNVQGLLVWNNFMNSIRSVYTRQRAQSYPRYIAPYYNLFADTPTTITSFTGYNIQVSYGYASSVQTPVTVRQTITDSYKCVPLNPESDLSGGALYIDSTTGTPLTNTLAKRQAEIANYNSKYTATIPYDILSKYSQIYLIVSLSIIGICIFIYLILGFFGGPALIGSGASRLQMFFAGVLRTPIYVVIAFFCTFIGMWIGISLASNVPAVPTTPTVTAVPATPATPAPASASGSASGRPSG